MPARGLLFHEGAALLRQPVELRLPAGVGNLPFGRQQLPVLEPVQRRIERALLDLDDLAGDLLQPLRDCVTVQRPERHDFENQQIERALRQVGLGARHRMVRAPHYTYTFYM